MGLTRWLAVAADRLLERLSPLDGADWLTRIEADTDVLGPSELLLMAEARHPEPPLGVAPPAGAPPFSPAGPNVIPARPSTWESEWHDLGVMQIPAFWTDDDNDFQSDITYLKGLVSWLVEQGEDGAPVRDIPAAWSVELACAKQELRNLRI